MARKQRIHKPGAFYHIMLRGNNGQSIFFSDGDRCRFCLLIQQGTERFNYRIHGFCFMSNHIHLILQAGENHLSKAMQHLSFRYTRYINRKEKRIGHLFQGRFKAILIDDSEYLLKLIRYVHLNPVRAGIVQLPHEYIWSGHRAYLELETLPWLTKDWILGKFDYRENLARKYYVQYVEKNSERSDSELFKKGSHEGRLLGSDDFINQILTEKNNGSLLSSYSLKHLIDVVCGISECHPSILQNPGKERKYTQLRALVALFVRRTQHLTLTELSRFTGKDVSSLSRSSHDLENKIMTDVELQQKVSKINLHLQNLNTQIAKSQA